MNTLDRIHNLLAQAQMFCLATVISSSDEMIPAGHKSIIVPGSTLEHGTGRPAVDEQLYSSALSCLSAQKKQTLEIQPGLMVFFDILSAAGSTPRAIGAKMIACADGSTFGSVGGGCGENQVKSAALKCLLVTKKPALIEVDLTDDIGTRGGDVCGGKMWIFIEPHF